jgi:transposase
LSLGVEERETLEGWARRPKTAHALAQRSRIVLACAGVSPNTVVADKLGVTYQTVGKWRRRFLERRLAGLLDEPRPGAPRAKWATRRLNGWCA